MKSSFAMASKDAVHIGIIDDEELVREGIVSLLERVADFQIVVSVSRAGDISDLSNGHGLDVVILSIGNHGPASFEPISEVQSRFPSTSVIVFDEAPRLFRLAQIARYRPAGYITKLDSVSDVIEAIRGVACGETRVSNAAATWIESTPAGWQVRKRYRTDNILRLTKRELQVLRCFAEGQTVKICAGLLEISPSTVENHRARIFKKLGVSKTVDMVRIALNEGVAHR